LLDHRAWVARLLRQRAAEQVTQALDRDRGENGPLVDRLEEVRREVGCAPEQFA